ncbi:MAG: hypothetical protein K1X95_14445, partial [Acidimicrobiia bacterium]|nr:hypothetical protein [Acidimicrobiia bacterium]
MGRASTERGELAPRVGRSILELPGVVAAAVPAVITVAAWRLGHRPHPARPHQPRFWLAAVLAVIGLTLGIATMSLFATTGRGTLAPWDPPEALVVKGPYRYVRNPMISGIMFLLAAEAAYLRSAGIAAWLAAFFAANSVWFPLVEEKGLEARFGADYLEYKANVARWLPRLRPW